MFVFILCKCKQEQKTFVLHFSTESYFVIFDLYLFFYVLEKEICLILYLFMCVYFFRRQPFVHFVGLRSPTGRVTGSLRKGCTSENAASSLENSQTFSLY